MDLNDLFNRNRSFNDNSDRRQGRFSQNNQTQSNNDNMRRQYQNMSEGSGNNFCSDRPLDLFIDFSRDLSHLEQSFGNNGGSLGRSLLDSINDRFNLFDNGNRGNDSFGASGSNNSQQFYDDDYNCVKDEFCIHMRGLPFNTTELDVHDVSNSL